MHSLFLTLSLAGCTFTGCIFTGLSLVDGPWSDKAASPEKRAQLLINAMNLTEKIAMLHGPTSCVGFDTCFRKGNYIGNVASNARLGIPPLNLHDGPQGFRDMDHPGFSTAFPAGITIAASWDLEQAKAWGEGIAKEFRAKGANVMLGPAIDVVRVPYSGRAYENLAGEDPHLGYRFTKAVVQGIQSQKVIATIKHWVLNHQETNRGHQAYTYNGTDPLGVSADVGERVRFEMYYPPYMGAVEADAGSAMCSYNRINDIWSCENPIITRDLEGILDFKGFVMADWGAVHSTSIMAGLDVEMPGAFWMNQAKILAGLANGIITEARVDDAVFRILRAMFAVGVMDEPASSWGKSRLDVDASKGTAPSLVRSLASNSTVLLKNDGGILPIPKSIRKLALIGFATDNAVISASGSGSVSPSEIVTPLAGIQEVAGTDVEITYNNGTDIDGAASLAEAAEYAIVFVGTISGEGKDRVSLSLDVGCTKPTSADTGKAKVVSHQCEGNANHQNELVAKVAMKNKRTVVVASIPGPVLLPWSRDVPAILTNFLPGQQSGGAIADILFGNRNPSAKLPITLPNRENELNFTISQYPGLPRSKPLDTIYSEGLFTGYRYYEAHQIEFTHGFPFGHGLSYTTFKFANLLVGGSNEVSFTVTNIGKVKGSEVAQLYVSFPESSGEPPLQLKWFQKTKELAPGESVSLAMQLRPEDLSIWNPQAHTWHQVAGSFVIKIGASSRDIRLEGTLTNLVNSDLQEYHFQHISPSQAFGLKSLLNRLVKHDNPIVSITAMFAVALNFVALVVCMLWRIRSSQQQRSFSSLTSRLADVGCDLHEGHVQSV